MRRRLYELEREASRLYADLTSARGERLPGDYLLADAGSHSVLVPVAAVAELVRLVDYVPLPNAPPFVLGTFLYRGTVVTVVDLARYLGTPHEPRLDAHVIVLSSSRPMALVVDQVRGLVEQPQVADQELPRDDSEVLTRDNLVVGLCVHEKEILPVIAISPLVQSIDKALA